MVGAFLSGGVVFFAKSAERHETVASEKKARVETRKPSRMPRSVVVLQRVACGEGRHRRKCAVKTEQQQPQTAAARRSPPDVPCRL